MKVNIIYAMQLHVMAICDHKGFQIIVISGEHAYNLYVYSMSNSVRTVYVYMLHNLLYNLDHLIM